MDWPWIFYCVAHPRTVDPDAVLLVVTYMIFFHVLMATVFLVVTEGNWLANWCNKNRDAELYQLGSPP